MRFYIRQIKSVDYATSHKYHLRICATFKSYIFTSTTKFNCKKKKKTKKPIADKKRLQFSVCASSFMLTTHVRLQLSNFEMISNIGLSRHFKSSFKLILYIRNIYFWQRLSFISICFLFLCCDVIVLKLLSKYSLTFTSIGRCTIKDFPAFLTALLFSIIIRSLVLYMQAYMHWMADRLNNLQYLHIF